MDAGPVGLDALYQVLGGDDASIVGRSVVGGGRLAPEVVGARLRCAGLGHRGPLDLNHRVAVAVHTAA